MQNLIFHARLRSSHWRCSVRKVVLRNFSKFTGKKLCQSLFFNKVARLRPATLLKKRLWHRCVPVNFAKFLRTPFFTEHLRWLLLKAYQLITHHNIFLSKHKPKIHGRLPLDTGSNLNVHKTFRGGFDRLSRRPGRLLCTFNLGPVSRELSLIVLLSTVIYLRKSYILDVCLDSKLASRKW